MPAKFTVGPFVDIDAAPGARNWKQDSDGTQRRMGNNAWMPRMLAYSTNNAVAWHPRTILTVAQPVACAQMSSSYDPAYLSVYLDWLKNPRYCRVHIIAVPRIDGTSTVEAYAMAFAYDGLYKTPSLYKKVSSVDEFDDVFEAEYSTYRVAATQGVEQNAIQTVQGYTILAATIEEEQLDTLREEYNHTIVNVELAKKGGKVLADLGEDIRAAIHEARQYQLPIVFSWSAFGITNKNSPPGDATGIALTSATDVNIFDQAVTARDEYSPGQTTSRVYAAKGTDTNIPVTCRVYAEPVGGNGYVTFIGPDHIAGNSTTITIDSAASAGWYGDDTNVIYLNAASATDDSTTQCNKIDVHARVDGGGTLYIWAATAWQTY